MGLMSMLTWWSWLFSDTLLLLHFRCLKSIEVWVCEVLPAAVPVQGQHAYPQGSEVLYCIIFSADEHRLTGAFVHVLGPLADLHTSRTTLCHPWLPAHHA